MTDEIRESAITRWRLEVWVKRADIDPRDEFDWYALAIGFFIAFGFNINAARELVEVCATQRIL